MVAFDTVTYEAIFNNLGDAYQGEITFKFVRTSVHDRTYEIYTGALQATICTNRTGIPQGFIIPPLV